MRNSESNPFRDDARKLQPKLRMFANGSTEVNALRSEKCSSLKVAERVAEEWPTLSMLAMVSLAVDPHAKIAEITTLREIPSDVEVNVFIETQDIGEDAEPLPDQTARKSTLVTATVPLSKLPELARRGDVTHIELGEPLATPTPVISAEKVGEPCPTPPIREGHKQSRGKGVLIGIIDVQGFDFAHPDFLRSGKTRFVRIWDQGGDARPGPRNAPYDYGAEFTQDHLNEAIRSSRQIQVPAQEIERQSQRAPSSHGTHVASIAAGNSGICPEGDIAAVLLSLPEDDVKRRKSFYDSTRIAHAIDYLTDLASERKQPISINVSLGTNGHAHDSSAAVSRWIDAALAVPGRCVCVAAGNAGQQIAEHEGDIGYVMGRIHTSGRVPSRGLDEDVEWEVVGNGTMDISENELEIWYDAQDRFAVSMRPPGSREWIGPVEPQEYIENRQLPEKKLPQHLQRALPSGQRVQLYLDLPQPSVQNPDGGRRPGGHVDGTAARARGTRRTIPRLDQRDDPRPRGRVGEKQAWNFPSYFSQRSNVDDSSVSSLACGLRIISVANLNEARELINITSSQGPTRDNRFKPDVAAPGTDIIAANGFAGEELWVRMSGTSMASPYVAAIAGLMLAVEPKLTAAQIEGILHRTSRPLPGADFAWRNDAGFGRIDPVACLKEAARINQRKDITE